MNQTLMEHEVLTVVQVARYLQLSEATTYKLVQQNKIPAFKIGNQWRVKKSELKNLLDRLQKGEKL